MKLVPIEKWPDAAEVLWDLLEERTPEQSISHKEMPSWDEHKDHLAHHTHRGWYLIECGHPNLIGDYIVGATYLSMFDEIGIQIFNDYRRNGYGEAAVRFLMKKYGKRRYLANINPLNEASRRLFEKLGFDLMQHTYGLAA